ncbi:MAG: hypothetical protein FJX72_00560 [Armatimonadetes bacterium]|nr:hypothetical protein [Armatimonadota bacterium]
MENETFALETYARRALNYLDRMVDADGLPYFNVFCEEPAEAAHDWPDFGDVMTRALQGAVMARRMTGRSCVNENLWLATALRYISPGTGLLTRPATSYCTPGADPGDYALTLYALVTVYDDAPDPALAHVIRRMVDAFPGVRNENPGFMAFVIKSLMAAARCLDLPQAVEYAGECVRFVTERAPIFEDDNTYPTGGHMHIFTRGLVGMADYALYVRDPVLFSRVDAVYRYLLGLDPGFGFLPEVVDRQGDVIACETCALMDYIGLGATLANNGHPEYWSGIERLARNHLVESQAADNAWLRSDPARPDTEQFTWRDIGDRMLGAYAGWSSPTQFLACRETLHWGGPELRGRTRAFQNCCGGSGTHALYIAWKNAARFDAGVLTVNMHLDKLLPQAEVRCLQPWRGELTVDLKTDCEVRVRTPDFTSVGDMEVLVGGRPVPASPMGCFVRVADRRAGERIVVRYPVPVRAERVSIGNRATVAPAQSHYPLMERPGLGKRGAFRQYRYSVTWKGDTVVRIEPVGRMPRTGYSDFETRRVEVYYGDDGPCRLYRRDHMAGSGSPELSDLTEDASPIDYWTLRA